MRGASVVADAISKLKLENALLKDIDGRTFSAATAQVTKLKLKKETQADGISLQNYLSLVKVACRIQPGKIMKVDPDELMASLVALRDHGVRVPLEANQALLTRRVSALLSQGSGYTGLLSVVTPWRLDGKDDDSAFDVLEPTMGALDEVSSAARVHMYCSHRFQRKGCAHDHPGPRVGEGCGSLVSCVG